MINDQCHIDPERMRRFFLSIDIGIALAMVTLALACLVAALA